MTARQSEPWADWARAVPALKCTALLHTPDKPARTAVHLTRAGLDEQYAVYEHAGVWYFVAGSAVTLTADATEVVARADGHTWTAATEGRPLDRIAEALTALGNRADGTRYLYGWATFELAHLLHGDPTAAGTQPLLSFLVPCVEVALSPGKAELRAVDEAWAAKVTALLQNPDDPVPADATMTTPAATEAERLIASDASAYRHAVARSVADIHAGLLEKAVLSRIVVLPEGNEPDFAASYLAGRRANTPARSFLLNLGGRRAAGFSPETIVEVEANGRIRTQPLAGTRALGPDLAENDRLREELRTDPKEVHEHAISVRLAAEEMETICRPGSVLIEEFMTVKARGSVQHLASRIAGQLREDLGPWSAFAALFPAVTVTGVPKSAALAALNRHEPEPRGLYGGAVFRAGTDGSLDAALVLRTLFAHGNRTWLRAGAGIMSQSTPEREYEETCEKLRSVVPHLRFHHT
ncbi:salicylate synthase [Streptosporangium sp. NBC_01755]|uniref:salicylate synthase n=1 Tax=unclassified Streptosporangium TaxID=2632669 RepID=UPI002DDC3EBA|nr:MULTISPECIES: salicylate synthase [unclassified Streptosporangium]WSA28630.1 salicylate synthase [Streptosporangium sp. NBC_01810]WSC99909.1 salicylate synthase [Streptosporangium sp. NBC_01755]